MERKVLAGTTDRPTAVSYAKDPAEIEARIAARRAQAKRRREITNALRAAAVRRSNRLLKW